MPSLPSRMLNALLTLHDNKDAILITKVPVKELKEGMVLHQDIISPTGEKLIAAGRRLTNPMVENLDRSVELVDFMVNVVANSAAGMALSN